MTELSKDEFFELLHEVDKEVADAYAAVGESAYGEYNIKRIEKAVQAFRAKWDEAKSQKDTVEKANVENATFCGQAPDQGRIIVGKNFPNEGYAVIRCGGTEVQIGYTGLHNLMIDISPNHLIANDQKVFQRALYSITCEASLGRTGD